MKNEKIKLVIVGHKDHGKSTLIGRLLYDSGAISKHKIMEIKNETKDKGEKFEFSYLLDSLEEEREGGLTIDIVQIPFKSNNRTYNIIDCPGHKEFIKNMLTGASQADVALLVVSAEEGIKEQTKQHMFFIDMLGIRQLIAVLNKMDKVNYDENIFSKLREELIEFLRKVGYEEVPVIPVSAYQGDNVVERSKNMKWYKGPTLIEALDEYVEPNIPPIDKPLIGFVQDIYFYEGRPLIICKIETGILKVNKKIYFCPSQKTGVIEKILSPQGEVNEAYPGESVGILLTEDKKVKRGNIITYRDIKLSTPKKFVAEIVLLRMKTLERDEIVNLRIGTAEIRAKILRIVKEIDPSTFQVVVKEPIVLGENSVGEVEIEPIDIICVAEYSKIPPLGRFVVLDDTGVLAAGIIKKTYLCS